MSDEIFYSDEGYEVQSLKSYAEKAYLDYSMYVILDRALPHLGDGLKPVQRRIIYAMSELGLRAGAKYKKSARTVGDVIGKFHPHGDSASYEAMVLMAQPFSYRYPLIDGQGNWGSIDDPKSFAAMRYTESRLAAYASVLLDELGQGTVEWGPNFDGTLDEPKVLPARVPNLLLNGTTGIAVGMATDVPPHNLREVVNACVHLIDNPKAELHEVMAHLPAPDYAAEAPIISTASELEALYRTGRGSVKQQAAWSRDENGEIVISALPHQTSGAKVLEQIAEQMNGRKLPMLTDLRDESDHENPVRLVLVPRSNRVNIEQLMGHLFASTDLERSHRVNLNVIGIDGRPAVKPLLVLLKEWISFRLVTVRRRLQYRLDKINQRLHLLEGLLIAFLNLDEVIRIIRSEDKPKPILMAQFALTDTQADYILDTRLRQLARLEEMKIREESAALDAERAEIERTLGSTQRLKTLVKKEMLAVSEQMGDPRRSPLVETAITSRAFTEEDLLTTEPLTVIVSQKGWVRAAKGHDIDPTSVAYKTGDGYLVSCAAKSNQQIVFLDSDGRSYSLPAHSLPSARGQGEPLTGRLSPASGSTFVQVLSATPDQAFVMASDAGYGFVCRYENMLANKKAGKALLTLPSGSQVLAPVPVGASTDLLVSVTSEGRMLMFPVSELPELVRGKGNKMIGIPSARVKNREEFLVSIAVLSENALLVVSSGKQQMRLKPSDLEIYRGERGRRGNKLPRGFQRVDRLTVETN